MQALFFLLFAVFPLQGELEVASVQMIWDEDDHSAFTDLIDTPSGLLCAFRVSDSHQDGKEGEIQLIQQNEAGDFKETAKLGLSGFDLRDPKLSYTPSGSMLLLTNAVHLCGDRYPCTFFSENGKDWSPPNLIAAWPGEWIWNLTWNQGLAYGISYKVNREEPTAPWVTTLFSTTDGIHFDKVANLEIDDPHANEATIRFEEDKATALIRASKTGFIGQSAPPYTDWEWTPTQERLGGPNFLIMANGEKIACSRKLIYSPEGKVIDAEVVVAKIEGGSYTPFLTLPSGGDCSYPGMVEKEGTLYISYYSSHEGKAKIYLATLR